MNRTSRRPALLAAAGIAALVAVAALGAPQAATAAKRPSGTSTSTKTSGPTCGGQLPLRPDGSAYRCTFTDDFRGFSIDTSKWLVAATAWSGFASGENCYVSDSRMVRVANGMLRLTSKKESVPFVCQSPFGSFTTDKKATSVTTRGRWNQAFGRFEFRARFTDSKTTGLHSALWLYPSKLTYGGWPNSGEIDVAEWFSRSWNYVIPSLHYQGTDTTTSQDRACQVPTAGTEFHQYAVEWLPDTMRFYYDGVLCHEQGWTPDAPLTGSQPFDQPFNIVMSQAMGQSWNAVDSTSATTGTLDVDWVRAWS